MSTQTHRLTVTELASSDDIAVLRVSGELDHTCEEFFLRTLGASVDAGHRSLVLDVTALVFCDSRGSTACSPSAGCWNAGTARSFWPGRGAA